MMQTLNLKTLSSLCKN